MPSSYSTVAEKLTPLLLMRHGITKYNELDLACGRGIDCPLSSRGVAQVAAVGRTLEAIGARPALIVHSPMQRTRETALHLAEICRADLDQEDDLAEQDLGKWEGQPWPAVLERLQQNQAPPGGESRDSFTQRVWGALRRLSQRPGGLSRTLLVAHGGTFFALGWPWLCVSQQVPNAAMFAMHYRATSPVPWEGRRLQANGLWSTQPLYEPRKNSETQDLLAPRSCS